MATDETEIERLADDVEVTEEQSELSLVKEQLGALVADVRHLAAAEIEYIKLRAAYSGNLAKWIGIYGGIAAAFAFCTIIALILGLLLIAAHYLDPVSATAIVTLTFGGIAIIAALLAKSKAKQLSFKSEPTDD